MQGWRQRAQGSPTKVSGNNVGLFPKASSTRIQGISRIEPLHSLPAFKYFKYPNMIGPVMASPNTNV